MKHKQIVFLGLSLSSSWGNGHATTFRSLIKGLYHLGHHVHFLEQDADWYRNSRDLEDWHYSSLNYYEYKQKPIQYKSLIEIADVVVIGSYIANATEIIPWVLENARGQVVFYDIDTPITLEKLQNNDYEYLRDDFIPEFDCYFSFTGGQILNVLMDNYKAKQARALYCSVDPDLYYPIDYIPQWKMGYLGTWSADRQPALERLLFEPAYKRLQDQFVVAGPQYPAEIVWPSNVEHINHLAPKFHNGFYNSQQFTLNVTRAAMRKIGWAPSVRLFEAAACGVAIISDYWPGLDDVLRDGYEILVANDENDVLKYLEMDAAESRKIGLSARERILDYHTGEKRAQQFLNYL